MTVAFWIRTFAPLFWITIGTPDALAQAQIHAEALREILNVSQLALEIQASGDTTVAVARAEGQKCERCWHWRDDVGVQAQHPTLCGRCVSNLFGAGEAREHA